MKALALGVVLFASAASAEAHRGWLTYAGLAVAGPGVVAMTLGLADAVESASARRIIAAYYAHGAAPAASDAEAVVWLRDRGDQKEASAVLLLGAGGAAALVGIAIVLLDGVWPGPSVAISVRPGSASMVLSGTF